MPGFPIAAAPGRVAPAVPRAPVSARPPRHWLLSLFLVMVELVHVKWFMWFCDVLFFSLDHKGGQ